MACLASEMKVVASWIKLLTSFGMACAKRSPRQNVRSSTYTAAWTSLSLAMPAWPASSRSRCCAAARSRTGASRRGPARSDRSRRGRGRVQGGRRRRRSRWRDTGTTWSPTGGPPPPCGHRAPGCCRSRQAGVAEQRKEGRGFRRGGRTVRAVANESAGAERGDVGSSVRRSSEDDPGSGPPLRCVVGGDGCGDRGERCVGAIASLREETRFLAATSPDETAIWTSEGSPLLLYSQALQAIAAEGDGLIVSYDYNAGKKAPLHPDIREAIERLEGKPFSK